jgi:hypothetical protein
VRYDEFRLHIVWQTQRTHGRVPGFYLSAAFSNEGERQDVVEAAPLNGSMMAAIGELLEDLLPVSGLGPIMARVGQDGDQARYKYADQLRERIRDAEEQLAVLEPS